jgi:hypothetical protein
MDEARDVAEEASGVFPLIIRPAFTLGGTGGGIAYNRDEFEEIAKRGIELSPVNEILVEESLLGWKEYEMEVMRDQRRQLRHHLLHRELRSDGRPHRRLHHRRAHPDPHRQGVPDHARPELRRDPRRRRRDRRLQHPVRRHPDTGRMVIIEMNPRVSAAARRSPPRPPDFPSPRSPPNSPSATCSTKSKNDITRETPASFEPSIDYVVTKIPRFAFEKFPQADPTLTTQMKSVGEAMAIGRTFKESLQKCLRSLEIGRSGLGGDGKPWRIGTEVYGDRDILPRDVISRKLSVPNAERIFFIRHALRAGFTIDEIFNLTKIDRWFLTADQGDRRFRGGGIGLSRIEQKFTQGLLPQMEIHPWSPIEVNVGNVATLKINSDFYTNPSSGHFEVREGHYISMEFAQPVHAKIILNNYAERLRRLFSVLTGTPVAIESVRFEVPNSGENPDKSELFRRNEAVTEVQRDLTATRMTAPYKDLTEGLPAVIAKWFEYHEQLDSVLNLYFAVLFNPSLYINHRFLFLAQALEIYHGSHTGFVGYVQRKEDFRERRKRIIQAAPQEEKEWLEEKLHYANQKTLAQRLVEILAKNKAEADQFIGDLQGFAAAVKNTRNYHTHFDEELKNKGRVTDDMEALVRLVSQMETLLGVCILKDLGVTGAPITRIIDRHKRMEITSLK